MSPIHRIVVAIKDPWGRSLPEVRKAAQLARGLGARAQLFHAPLPGLAAGNEERCRAGAHGIVCFILIASRRYHISIACTPLARIRIDTDRIRIAQ